MSDIELLPAEGAEQPGFSPEPADSGPSHDLAVSDGASGLGGAAVLSDEAGASEFGADEAATVDAFAAAPVEAAADDSDLLDDPEVVPAEGKLASGDVATVGGDGDIVDAPEVAEPDDAEFAASMERMAADLAAITEQDGGSDRVTGGNAADPVELGGNVATDQADGPQTHIDPVEQADDEDVPASDRQPADPSDSETSGSGRRASTEQHIGQLAADAGYDRVIIDTGSRAEPVSYAEDRSVATLERPHVGDRYQESDQLRQGRTAGERARLQQLERLPHTGFTSHEIRQVRAQIAALGYPVDNFRQFNHKHNERGTEDANTIASWLGHGHGEFTVYDLYHKQIPEKRLGTLSHETAHANSPLKPENEAVYGQSQAEAARFVNRVAQQSLQTNVHLNGYHKYLMSEYRTNMDKLTDSHRNGHITDYDLAAAKTEVERKFNEETWAIMNEMALTNRAGLADVEARQFKALDKLADQPPRVALISDAPTDEKPNPTTYGIDRWLIHLIDGVNNQQDLVQHVATLKQRFYGAANNERAEQRVQRRYAQAA